MTSFAIHSNYLHDTDPLTKKNDLDLFESFVLALEDLVSVCARHVLFQTYMFALRPVLMQWENARRTYLATHGMDHDSLRQLYAWSVLLLERNQSEPGPVIEALSTVFAVTRLQRCMYPDDPSRSYPDHTSIQEILSCYHSQLFMNSFRQDKGVQVI
jgi:hypothetical protein